MDRPVILIGGGVGPMAGVELHRRIIQNTRTDGTDQDHLEVLHLSRSGLVSDRTEYLLGKDVSDPAEGMIRVFSMAAGALAAEGRHAVAGIPCNTFHAPRIFDRFLQGLIERNLPIQVVPMIRTTLDTVARDHSAVRTVGVLSTTGTRLSSIYRDELAARGLSLVQVPEEEQPDLHAAIYDPGWGLKAVSPPHERAVRKVRRFAQVLIESGAELIILGCTELPLAIRERDLAGIPLLDPVNVLARELVCATAPEKLIPETGERPLP